MYDEYAQAEEQVVLRKRMKCATAAPTTTPDTDA